MSTALILSIDRRNSASEALDVVDLALRFRDEGVVGIDLCGDPSVGDVSIFAEAFARTRAAGLKITLHFAEVATQAVVKSERLPEGELMMLLGCAPDRIGHVIHVPEEVKAVVRERRLGLELCLSCNVHAKMMVGEKRGYGDHHFGEWVGSECPVVLCVS